jgi:hypothetical protein
MHGESFDRDRLLPSTKQVQIVGTGPSLHSNETQDQPRLARTLIAIAGSILIVRVGGNKPARRRLQRLVRRIVCYASALT